MEIFRKIILPQLVPHIITACRVSLGVCWATLVAAEMIAAQRGIGAMMVEAQNFFQMAPLVLGILMIGAIALIMDGIVRTIERRVTAWQEKLS
jgi:NitT/TauT family transport system permease protein